MMTLMWSKGTGEVAHAHSKPLKLPRTFFPSIQFILKRNSNTEQPNKMFSLSFILSLKRTTIIHLEKKKKKNTNKPGQRGF